MTNVLDFRRATYQVGLSLVHFRDCSHQVKYIPKHAGMHFARSSAFRGMAVH